MARKTGVLPNLTQPSLIILDNAAYHRTYPNFVPKVGKLKKTELQEYLTDNWGHDVEDLTVVEMQKIARDYIVENEKLAVTLMSQPYGHVILFTPPYHSDTV